MSSVKTSLKILVITGGKRLTHHLKLVPSTFYSMFEGHPDIDWDHASSQEAAFMEDISNIYDVVVFYNREDDIEQKYKENLKKFVNADKGVIIFHSAIGNYNNWEWWWKEVVGGKYQMKTNDEMEGTKYFQDQEIKVIKKAKHPIIDDLENFSIHDEVYLGQWISDNCKVILETDNKNSDPPLVWISPFQQSRVIYIQPGHAKPIFRNKTFVTLMHNSILWVGKRL
jgi:type 1 glutamine amidotransferase